MGALSRVWPKRPGQYQAQPFPPGGTQGREGARERISLASSLFVATSILGLLFFPSGAQARNPTSKLWSR
jgi:hypothetical protein